MVDLQEWRENCQYRSVTCTQVQCDHCRYGPTEEQMAEVEPPDGAVEIDLSTALILDRLDAILAELKKLTNQEVQEVQEPNKWCVKPGDLTNLTELANQEVQEPS